MQKYSFDECRIRFETPHTVIVPNGLPRSSEQYLTSDRSLYAVSNRFSSSENYYFRRFFLLFFSSFNESTVKMTLNLKQPNHCRSQSPSVVVEQPLIT